MNKFTERDIRAHAKRDYPRESCGLIVAMGKREKYISCPNIAPDKKTERRQTIFACLPRPMPMRKIWAR